jgi:hypothetical protein
MHDVLKQTKNITLNSKFGKRKFHDLIRNKLVIVDFFYCRCEKKCIPTGKNIKIIIDLLGDKIMEENIHFIRISLDPTDTLEDVQEYSDICGLSNEPSVKFYQNDNAQELLDLRVSLGMYEEPLLDKIKENHRGSLLILNEKMNSLTMVGGWDNVINSTRRILQHTFYAAKRSLRSMPLDELRYDLFKNNQDKIFNNLKTMSPKWTVPFLPENIKEALRVYISKNSDKVFTYKKDDNEQSQKRCCCK